MRVAGAADRHHRRCCGVHAGAGQGRRRTTAAGAMPRRCLSGCITPRAPWHPQHLCADPGICTGALRIGGLLHGRAGVCHRCAVQNHREAAPRGPRLQPPSPTAAAITHCKSPWVLAADAVRSESPAIDQLAGVDCQQRSPDADGSRCLRHPPRPRRPHLSRTGSRCCLTHRQSCTTCTCSSCTICCPQAGRTARPSYRGMTSLSTSRGSRWAMRGLGATLPVGWFAPSE